MTTLIGMVAFGNLPFTKMAIESIEETTTEPYEIFVVVGKPGDVETAEWLSMEGIPHIVHQKNMGFPSSLNDILDYTWKDNDFDNLVIMGNDVIALPYAIDSLIKVSDTTDYIWISASEIDVRVFCSQRPEVGKYFYGANYIFRDFDARPWKEFPLDVSPEISINPDISLKDCHNLSIFKRDIFDKLGYTDVNFYPAYYEDNDFVRRAILDGTIRDKSKFLDNALYFHFWSRTIKQETGGSTHEYFRNNEAFYRLKWGGLWGNETFDLPFDGETHGLTPEVMLESTIKIESRDNEEKIVDYWIAHRGSSLYGN